MTKDIDIIMREVYRAASRSMDPRTKIGCVVAHPTSGMITAAAANRPARGISLRDCVSSGLSKHIYMEHAERIAIQELCKNSGFDGLSGYTVFVNETPCFNCVNSIIESGIRGIVTCDRWYKHCEKFGPDPAEKFDVAAKLMNMAGGYVGRVAFQWEEPVSARRDDMDFNVMEF